MAGRDQIIDFMDELLDAQAFQDHGPNGLQVPGADEVSLLATGVSANRQTIEQALMGGQDQGAGAGKLPTTVEEITADPEAAEAWDRPEIQTMWLELVRWSMGLVPGDATPRPAPGR